MDKKEYVGLAISDFNMANFSGYINNDQDSPVVNMTVAPFGQVTQTLMDDKLECWNRKYDFAIIWTLPQNIILSFNDVFNYKNTSMENILKEVEEFASLILQMKEKFNFIFVPTWVTPHFYRGFGMIDMKHGFGVSNILMHMNLRLSENLHTASNIYLFNTEKWIANAGRKSFNPKLWYTAKIPFGNEVFKDSVKDIKASLRGLRGEAKKLVVVDLDDTLWGGIVGDVGWENIHLGGHDPIGEAYVDFQKSLKSLTNRGIVLGIVSKNEESVALEAINNHPEMILQAEDFAGWRINWHDKAQNIIDLAADLNLGIQSIVFIDDNPVERARVQEALPEVLVPEWPEDIMLYNEALHSLCCFDTPSISEEDLERSKMYKVEQQRTILKKQAASLDEWLMTLEIKVKIEELNRANLARTTQLFNKTNQINLSTRRMTETELVHWAEEDGHKVWTFRVADKFGDLGLTGIISFEVEGNKGRIVDFILSCRAMGRKVEQTMISTAFQHAKSIGLDSIYAKYIPTSKNKPCLEFLHSSMLIYDEKYDHFQWSMINDYSMPEQVAIEMNTM